MFKVQRGLEKVEWVKPPLLTKNNDHIDPASGVRGNSLRLRRESFKSKDRFFPVRFAKTQFLFK